MREYKDSAVPFAGAALFLKKFFIYDETAVVLSSFSDVCSEAELLLPLIETCNSLQLDPIHLADVVDDFLGSL